jgi:hypothetical protein
MVRRGQGQTLFMTKMKYSLLISAVVLGTSIVIASCKKAEEAKVKRVKEFEEVQAYIPKQGLAGTMKKASLVMRRLSRAVENNDWVEMDMWTKELKEGIGHNCVELYMIENNDVSSEFVTLSNKFNSAINKLILCSKEHNTNSTNPEFNNLIKSCDACHESFNKAIKGQLEFTDQENISLN